MVGKTWDSAPEGKINGRVLAIEASPPLDAGTLTIY